MKISQIFLLGFIGLFLTGCSRSEQSNKTSLEGQGKIVKNKYAQNFMVKEYKGFKKITVNNPWRNSNEDFQYILKHRGVILDTVFSEVQVIDTPVEKIITLSTVYLPLIDSLGGVERIVAVSDANHVNNPIIRKKLEQGKIPQVKMGGNINYELMMEIQPDVIFTFAVGDPNYDSHSQLHSRKLPIVLMSSYMEDSPLGRAEWIKFMGHFLEKESLADSIFARVDSAYNKLKALSSSIKKKPQVFSGAVFGGVWHVPGGNSFTARLFKDAGANYLWKENTKRGGVPISFEEVYEKAAETNYWLNPSKWQSLEEGLNQDQRYSLFSSFKHKRVYNHNARTNLYGGDDYFETGSANPHLVLKDLIKIFHPNLLPDDSLYFYQKLN